MMDLLQSRNLKSISASCNYNVSNLPGFPGQADGDCGSSTNYYGQILLIVMDQSLSLSKWYQFPSITAAWICYEQYICHSGMQTWWWASVRSLLDERLRRWSSSDPTLLTIATGGLHVAAAGERKLPWAGNAQPIFRSSGESVGRNTCPRVWITAAFWISGSSLPRLNSLPTIPLSLQWHPPDVVVLRWSRNLERGFLDDVHHLACHPHPTREIFYTIPWR